MIKPHLSELMKQVTLTISAAVLLSGCQTNLGPWERQAYAPPSLETPTNKIKVTPGARLPFKQGLPTGNLNTNPAFENGR